MLFIFGVAFGYAVLRSQALPRWVSWSSFAIAVIHLAAAPSMFFGFNSSQFYASNGWGAVAMVNGCTAIWLAAVGITILVKTNRTKLDAR
jgi:hypothetical protein